METGRIFDVTALGELLIDFTSLGRGESGMRIFEQNPGGAPANVACAASRLGLKAAFLGKIGADMHGAFLRSVLTENGVDVAGLVTDPEAFTTLAFVDLHDGERSFSFARKPGADTRLDIRDLRLDVIRNSRVFHIGSLSLTDQPARSATLYALEQARAARCIISYDPNYRALLWRDREQAGQRMRSVLPFMDLIKISREETALLTGVDDPETAVEELVQSGIPVAVVTLGAGGAWVGTKEGTAVIPAKKVPVADTTGAGDAFWGGFLAQLVKAGIHPGELSLERAAAFTGFANRVAGFCVGRRGGINGMPDMEDLALP